MSGKKHPKPKYFQPAYLLIGSRGKKNLMKFDYETGNADGIFLFGGPSPLEGANSSGHYFCEYGPNGDLYVQTMPGGWIDRYDGASGKYLTSIGSTDKIGYPNFVFNDSGEILAPDYDSFGFRYYDQETGALNKVTALTGDIYNGTYYRIDILGNVMFYILSTQFKAGMLYVLIERIYDFEPPYDKYLSEAIIDCGIIRFDAITGNYIDDFVPYQISQEYWKNFVFGNDGNIYVSVDTTPEELGPIYTLKVDGSNGSILGEFTSKITPPGNGTFDVSMRFSEEYFFLLLSEFTNEDNYTGILYRYDAFSGVMIDEFIPDTLGYNIGLTLTPWSKPVLSHGPPLWALFGLLLKNWKIYKQTHPGVPIENDWTRIAEHIWPGLSNEEQDALLAFSILEMSAMFNDREKTRQLSEIFGSVNLEKYPGLQMAIEKEIISTNH